MAKSILKIKAQKLRRGGCSIKSIEKQLLVSRSTISRWCEDIILSREQVKRLLANKNLGLRKAQLIGSQVLKNRRLNKIEEYHKEGLRRFNKLTEQEFYTAGLALYLAEGSKKDRRIMFTNSDPKIIKFMLKWFRKFYGIKKVQTVFSVSINITHHEREVVVRGFWSKYLDVPLSQFRKTKLVKTRHKKIYENHNNYYGTLTFSVLKSSDLCYKILGQMDGLLGAKIMSA